MSVSTATPAAGTLDATALRQQLVEAGVRYAIANYVDLHGRCKGKVVPIDHLPQMLAGSEMYTGLALDGVPQAINDDEVCTMPDANGHVILPWEPSMAWFPSDLYLKDAPFPACSRNILKRVVERAAKLDLTMNLGIEVEFFVFKQTEDGGEPQPVYGADTLAKPCYDIDGLLANMHWMDEVVQAMNGLGWDAYSFDHEDANGQFELDFGYTDALGMSDRLVFLRLMLNELLKKYGYFPSFMPKPFADKTGNGGHFNMSLARDGSNAFADKDDPRGCGLSKLGYHFIAGILKHAAAVAAVVAPTVNSYKRLVKQGSMSGSTWAPVFACYGNNNRTNMLRIPMGGGRVECRAADSAVNPYLASALIFAAGLEGIEQELDPGEPNRENMYLCSDAELAARGITTLPSSLGEAIEAFAVDPLAREVFGDAMFTSFVDYKRGEWNEYHNHVSQWERERYLSFF